MTGSRICEIDDAAAASPAKHQHRHQQQRRQRQVPRALEGAKILEDMMRDQLSAMLFAEPLYACAASVDGRCRWRTKIAEWMYEVVDYYGADREAVSVSMNLLDRFVRAEDASSARDVRRRGETMTSETYQLAAAAALFVAVKASSSISSSEAIDRFLFHPDALRPTTTAVAVVTPTGCDRDDSSGGASRRSNRLTSRSLADLSRENFSSRDLEAMEMRMLMALRWRIHPPAPAEYVRRFLMLLRSHLLATMTAAAMAEEEDGAECCPLTTEHIHVVLQALHDICGYLVELTILAPDTVAGERGAGCCATAPPPSTVAFAAVLMGLNALTPSALGGIELGAIARRTFLSDVAILSSTLRPEEPRVSGMIARLSEAFGSEIELLLNGGEGEGNADDGGTAVAYARDAGLLDASALLLKKKREEEEGAPPPPPQPQRQQDRVEQFQRQQQGEQKEDWGSCSSPPRRRRPSDCDEPEERRTRHRRNSSPTSVADCWAVA